MTKKMLWFYSARKKMKRQFPERVTTEKWFQKSDWQPYEPEDPQIAKPIEEQKVTIEDTQGNKTTLEEKTEPPVESGGKEKPKVKEEEVTEAKETYESMSNDELKDAFKEKFGKKPHHKSGREKIIKKLKDGD